MFFDREDVRKIPAIYRQYGRFPSGSVILRNWLPSHFSSLKSLTIQMVDHVDTDLQQFLIDLISVQTHLCELRLTAFLTRDFSIALMNAIRNRDHLKLLISSDNTDIRESETENAP